jgi:uncharacterized membrane protein YphA (DoxX/SURF4 family)
MTRFWLVAGFIVALIFGLLAWLGLGDPTVQLVISAPLALAVAAALDYWATRHPSSAAVADESPRIGIRRILIAVGVASVILVAGLLALALDQSWGIGPVVVGLTGLVLMAFGGWTGLLRGTRGRRPDGANGRDG